jgi:carbonic anhydrase
MDPRLNEYLDKKYLADQAGIEYGQVEIWRNASGRLPPVEELLSSGAKRIILAPHTDCKAKEHMYKALLADLKKFHQESMAKDEREYEDEIVDQALHLVGAHQFATREEFDNLVNSEEEIFLKDKLAKHQIEVKLEVVDLEKIGMQNTHANATNEDTRRLVISNETNIKSKDIASKVKASLQSCYIIQGPYLKDLNPDINLAISLGIKRMNIITEEGHPFK